MPDTHLAGRREKESFWAEASVFIAALVSVLGTIGAIHYSSMVSHLKDVALDEYKQQAAIQIGQASGGAARALSDAATANQKAEEAGRETAKLKHDNLLLKAQLKKVDIRTARRLLSWSPDDTNALLPYAGMSVFMMANSDDQDGRELYQSLTRLLASAGIQKSGFFVLGAGGMNLAGTVGIHIRYGTGENDKDLAEHLLHILLRDHIQAEIGPGTDFDLRKNEPHASPISVAVYIGGRF